MFGSNDRQSHWKGERSKPYELVAPDTSRFRFTDLVAEAFGTPHLELLHTIRPDLMPEAPLEFENESRTKFHDVFYRELKYGKPALRDAYETLIRDVIAQTVDDVSFAYQGLPSFRIHLPGDRAIHKWHYDGDAEHQHPRGEVNYQLALTDCFDSNATWIESEPGLGDYQPIELKKGQCVRFFGNKLRHGNKVNETGVCRLSFDFRVLPMSKYQPSTQHRSMTSQRRFCLGEYYKRFP